MATRLILLIVGLLLSLGLVMLYSANMAREEGGHKLFLMQLVWCSIGVVACGMAAWLDYRGLKRVAWGLFAAVVVLLGLLLVPGVGFTANGATRWFDLGYFHFQPSELAKIGVVVMLAWYAERYQRYMRMWSWGFLVPALLSGLVIGLVFVEPDRGTAALIGAVCASLLLVAGVRWVHLIPAAVAAFGALVYSLLNDPVRLRRLQSWLNMEDHKQDAGYQAWQSMIALGSGGWRGLGLGDSRQKLGFVPEHQTDFILSIIGEELGLIATLGIVAGFLVITVVGFYIASRAPDVFGMLLGTGVTFLISLQAFINISVVTGALPNKGLPLPFISYGGSNLLLMMVCVGLLVSIARQSSEVEQSQTNPFYSKHAVAFQAT